MTQNVQSKRYEITSVQHRGQSLSSAPFNLLNILSNLKAPVPNKHLSLNGRMAESSSGWLFAGQSREKLLCNIQ